MKKLLAGIFSLAILFSLAACGNENGNGNEKSVKSESTSSQSHMEMNHSGSSNVPKGMKEEKNPKYKTGSQVIIHADHMEGMNGAKATVKAAYATTVYMVNYKPETGGAEVKNHKWVVQEEIKAAGKKTLKPGTKVTLEADHMEGMKGASAEIVSSKKTTVYMVDYTPANGGEKVKNHKWLTEDELAVK
ncbi:YdhK family protein [Heyndrickxia acidiproducens]|uniref:YdhK family protein n=1 Tax=Heyndrickxia acidiproducens TaxID=1121084 RepID=UPI000477710F|nr:YdhK family protein [Heyndrickxia acidiproducens]